MHDSKKKENRRKMHKNVHEILIGDLRQRKENNTPTKGTDVVPQRDS